MKSELRFSIVIPAKNEPKQVVTSLSHIADSVNGKFECLIVVDSNDDLTFESTNFFLDEHSNFSIILNEDEPGPAGALKTGIRNASTGIIVVTMADGSDDPRQIEELVWLVERGVTVATASRYVAGGQAVGAPFLKSFLSKSSGKSLQLFRRIGTHDATNSFKAYAKSFLNSIDIESKVGFEIGLELVAKAFIRSLPIAEIPTVWIERNFGKSKFRVWKWLPHYLKWYLFALFKRRSRHDG